MLLSICSGQAEEIFSVKDVLVLDPVNNPELTVELYEEMLEFEKQLHGHQDTNEISELVSRNAQGKVDERLIV